MGTTINDISDGKTTGNVESPCETPDQAAEGAGEKQQDKPPSVKTSWTILLDIAADGSLANFAVESLKQLRNSASQKPDDADAATVKVAAQFSVDAPAGQKVSRYVFDEDCTGSLRNCIKKIWNAPCGITEKDALVDFLQWAYNYRDEKTEKDLKAEHYALILWGHGPILLLQPPPGPGHASISLYLTPADLSSALRDNPPPTTQKRFDLVAFDACAMSMLELAYEIRNYAQYMVASQEDVPDLSFPYDTIVPLFRKHGDKLEPLLQGGVNAYVEAYQDYINSVITNTKPVTLSALRLSALLCPQDNPPSQGNPPRSSQPSKCKNAQEALRKLSCALYCAKDEPSLPFLLLEARTNTQEFVSGLYVDLSDFASALISALDAEASVNLRKYCKQKPVSSGPDCWMCAIRKACVAIIDALDEDTEDTGDLLVLANGTENGECNGVSLYLPYLSSDESAGITRPIIKGEDSSLGIKGEDASRGIKGEDASRGIKDFSSVLNEAAPFQLLFERRKLITDTEGYYEKLQLSQDTGWYRFIVEQWTPILVNVATGDLDLLYSAEQAAINACRGTANSVKVKEGLCSDCPCSAMAVNSGTS
jgi:hypothetical protein